MPFYNYEPQSMLENSGYKLYCDGSIITGRTIHTISKYLVLLYKTIKKACLIDVAIRNIHNLHCIITEKLQKDTGLTEELVRISQLKTVYIIPLILSTLDIMPNKLHDIF